MQYRVNNEMVAHLWANKAQDRAHSDNMRFENDCIYSYWLCIGKHVTNKKGKQAILLYSGSYSITTSRHQSIVRSSIPDNIPVFYVSDLDNDHNKNLQDLRDKVDHAIVKINAKRHVYQYDVDVILSLIDNYNEYAEFFGYKKRIRGLNDQQIAELQDRVKQTKIKREEQIKRKAERDRARVDQYYKDWQSGNYAKCDNSRYNWDLQRNIRALYGDLLRVDRENDRIITSQNADVPIDHCVKAFPMIKKCHDENREFISNGHKIKLGHFGIDRIDANGDLYAGCHHVKYTEVLRIAEQLNLV